MRSAGYQIQHKYGGHANCAWPPPTAALWTWISWS